MAGSAREKPERPLLLSLIAILVLLLSAAEIVLYASYAPTMLEAGMVAAVLIGLALSAFYVIAGAGFLLGWKWSRTLFFVVYTADMLIYVLYGPPPDVVTIATYGVMLLIVIYLYKGSPDRYFKAMEEYRSSLLGFQKTQT
jgi:hypothetical protein